LSVFVAAKISGKVSFYFLYILATMALLKDGVATWHLVQIKFSAAELRQRWR